MTDDAVVVEIGIAHIADAIVIAIPLVAVGDDQAIVERVDDAIVVEHRRRDRSVETMMVSASIAAEGDDCRADVQANATHDAARNSATEPLEHRTASVDRLNLCGVWSLLDQLSPHRRVGTCGRREVSESTRGATPWRRLRSWCGRAACRRCF